MKPDNTNYDTISFKRPSTYNATTPALRFVYRQRDGFARAEVAFRGQICCSDSLIVRQCETHILLYIVSIYKIAAREELW